MNWFFCIWKNDVELFSEILFQFERHSFSFEFFRVVKVSKASMESDAKSPGLKLQSKMVSWIKLDEIDRENGICSPIRIIFSLSMKFLSSAQIDSESNQN